MKKNWKFASLGLAALLAVTAMAGCGGGNNSSNTSGGSASSGTTDGGSGAGGHDPIVIRLSAAANFEFDPASDEMAKMIQDKFNITFENVGYEGDVEKMMLDAQSGEMADIVYTEPLYDLYSFATFIDQGFFRDLPNEIIAKYPNVNKQLSDSDVCKAIVEQYGANYILPKPDSLDPSYYVAERKGIFYRKDWLANVGITEEPKTYEDFYNMCKAFTLNDPDGNGKNDTYGLTSDGFGNFRYFLASTGHSNMNWVKGEDGTWTHGALMEDNIEPLEWFRKMYAEGYIDPELGNTDYTQAMQKFASETFGAVNRNADADWLKNVIVDQFYAANSDKYENPFDVIGVIGVLALDDQRDPGIDKYIDAMCATQVASTCDDATLERYLEFHEWLLSDEGRLMQLGLEGKDWQKDGEKISMITGEDGLMPDVSSKYKSLPVVCMPSWGFDLRSNPNIQSFTIFNDEIKALDEQLRNARNPYAVASDMRVKMLSDQALLDANSFKFSVEYGNIVMGTEPVEAMFQDMVSRAMASGFTEAIEYVNKVATEKGW